MKWYVGVSNCNKTMTIFKADVTPIEKTHGHLYGHVFGGYKTRKQALNTASYQCPTYKTIILKGT